MWYYSRATGKIFPASCSEVIDFVLGEDTFLDLIGTQDIVRIKPENNPSVIDILKNSGNISYAIDRYQEIHHCDAVEACFKVAMIALDMKEMGNKHWKHKKKSAATVGSQDSSVTTK